MTAHCCRRYSNTHTLEYSVSDFEKGYCGTVVTIFIASLQYGDKGRGAFIMKVQASHPITLHESDIWTQYVVCL